MSSNIIYVGVKAHVVALDKKDGTTLWQTKLKSGFTSGDRFVTLLVENGRIYAHTHGEVFCLDEATGAVLWNNGLAGLGYETAMLATDGVSSNPVPAEFSQQKQHANRNSNAAIGRGDA